MIIIAQVVMTNGFALNHDYSLQIFSFSVKRKARNLLSERCQMYSKYLDTWAQLFKANDVVS